MDFSTPVAIPTGQWCQHRNRDILKFFNKQGLPWRVRGPVALRLPLSPIPMPALLVLAREEDAWSRKAGGGGGVDDIDSLEWGDTKLPACWPLFVWFFFLLSCVFFPKPKFGLLLLWQFLGVVLYINILVRLKVEWGEGSGAPVFHKIEEMGKRVGFFPLTSRNHLVSCSLISLFPSHGGWGVEKDSCPGEWDTAKPCGLNNQLPELRGAFSWHYWERLTLPCWAPLQTPCWQALSCLKIWVLLFWIPFGLSVFCNAVVRKRSVPQKWM